MFDAVAIPFRKSDENYALIHEMTHDLFKDYIPYVQYMLSDDDTRVLALSPAPCPIPKGYETMVADIIAAGGQFNTWVSNTDALVHISVGAYPQAVAEFTLHTDDMALDDMEFGTKIKEQTQQLIAAAHKALVPQQ